MPLHKNYYERNLPHIQPANGTFFLTYRLFDSIPLDIIRRFKTRFEYIRKKSGWVTPRRLNRLRAAYFERCDRELDKQLNGPFWLKDDRIAQIVYDSLLYNHGKEYDLWSFSIMPNHVHTVLTLKNDSLPLYKILQNHKRFTAMQSNQILNRRGYFWDHETYDHLVKTDDELFNIVNYILNNSVKAGFVKDWRDWKGNYLNPLLFEKFPNEIANSWYI